MADEKKPDARPEFAADAPYNEYEVEALEKFVIRTTYKGVKARSEAEAEWLVRNGKVGYDDHEIEEGDEEFLSIEETTLREEGVEPDAEEENEEE